jgi:hypothetical protein
MESQDKPSIYVPHYLWSGFGGVISATKLHTTLYLALVLEGGYQITFMVTGLSSTPYHRLLCFFL